MIMMVYEKLSLSIFIVAKVFLLAVIHTKCVSYKFSFATVNLKVVTSNGAYRRRNQLQWVIQSWFSIATGLQNYPLQNTSIIIVC